MSMSKHNKIHQWLNYRMRVTIQDNRTIIGTFLAFDKHMNLVLADAEEFRVQYAKKKGGEDREERRALGLLVIRGECVISLSVDGPPPGDENGSSKSQLPSQAGPGMGRAAGRGVPIPVNMPAVGLAGPMRGVGAPATAMMTPAPRGPQQVAAAAPMSFPLQQPGMPNQPVPGGFPPQGFPGFPPGRAVPFPLVPGMPGAPGAPPAGFMPPGVGVGRGVPQVGRPPFYPGSAPPPPPS
eukprot:c18204_g1_i2.p1 GENE.c18204_g1_i2~~c18204_g1_i2.p1  ORF type:complete len:238 (+),score=113.29 c18204_g1_i2:35-748(+)